MRRFWLFLGFWLLIVPLVSAQSESTSAAEPCPAVTNTTVVGPPGTVEPSYQIAVESIYTGEVVYGTADSEGGFAVDIVGLPGMPVHVYSARSITQAMRSANELPPGRAILLNAPDTRPIAFGGQLAYGMGTWLASGDVTVNDGAVSAMLNVTFLAPAADLSLPFTLVGGLGLLPLTDASGIPFAPANADWSPEQTASGLPILGAPQAIIPIATAITTDNCVDAENGLMIFSLAFQGYVQYIPDGLYQWVFDGRIAVADSMAVDWYANRLLGTGGKGPQSTSQTELPATLNIGDVQPQLLVAVDGYLSDGSPVAMLHSVTYQPNTWIQPFGELALEARIMAPWQAQLGQFASMQFNLSGDSGTVSLPSTQAHMEWDGQFYILVSDEPLLPALENDGQHALEGQVSLNIDNVRQNALFSRAVVAAEPLHLIPAVLPGTTFMVGDSFVPGIYSQPALNQLDGQAEITLTFYPLSGEPQAQAWTLPLQYSVAQTPESFRFDQPGHYVVEYEVSGIGPDGRFWAGSLRTVGVVAQPGNHTQGQRGVVGYGGNQQAWFDMSVFPSDNPNIAPVIYPPAFSGDVAYLPDEADTGMQPLLTSPDASPNAFAIFSAVRPDVRLRQAVMRPGLELPNLIWRNDDLLDGQIGAGITGNRNGDLALLFGGVVDESSVSGYASLAVITDDDDSVRVLPPFQQPISNADDYLLYLPGTVRPGQIVPLSGEIAVSGQFAPTLPAALNLIATSPSGAQQNMLVQANDYGYLASENTLHFDESGIWQITATGAFAGQTSAAAIDEAVSGGVPGVADTFAVYVLPDDAVLLTGAQPQVAPGNPVVLSVDVPEGWTQVSAHVTAATASQQLDTLSADVTSARYSYRYDPNQLSRTFPNIEPNGTGNGTAASDAVWVTIVLSAMDANGQPVFGYRQFTVLHDRVE